MLKKKALVISIVYTLVLTYVSLVKLNNVPDIGVSFGDKIFHFLAYSLLTFLWFNTFLFNFNYKEKKAITYAAIISIVFGIVVEVLQEILTVYRTMDIYDVMANTSGVLVTVLVIVLIKNIDVKKI
ncbi:VanZ family protein [Thalassobellus suaedae]|uniref:VanZ family protein n=1 Tax=Thalassobellus suaedae TaxID=3074124 RepID=A0ABY9Y8C8_9FLAO|nr:VanZ family protein [Flavobacteriaceae bacterium HL-DH10]